MVRTRALAVAFAAVVGFAGPGAQASPAQDACTGLNALTIPASAIGLPTGGARVTDAEFVPASGTGVAAIAEHCKVSAAISPLDPAAGEIRFALALPTDWNGKTLMLGGGAFDGSIPNVTGNYTVGPVDRPPPVTLGYAVYASDSGHQGSTANAPGVALDATFALNDESLRNWAGDALKKTRDAALRLIVRRYAKTPVRRYFAGGSNGGREGFAVMQRWPRDFDGAVVAYPYWNAVVTMMTYGRNGRALAAAGAYPGPAKQATLFNAVMAACDGLDGVKDGLISNVAACHFDLASIRCAGGGDTGDTCLSDAQIAAIKTIDSPVTYDYPLGAGETAYPGWPVLSGADLRGGQQLSSTAPAYPPPPTSPPTVLAWEQFARYAVARDPGLNWLNLDAENPGVYKARLGYLEGLIDVPATDLFAFQNHGGKLLVVQGLADAIVSPRSTFLWYHRLLDRMGAPTVRNFSRLYTVPGYGHGAGGLSAFMAAWDSLSTLDAWVEHGTIPANQIVTDTNAATKGRTRPLCEYPAWPKYNGSGDLAAAASFTCTTE